MTTLPPGRRRAVAWKREITQLESEVLGALEGQMGIEEAYAVEKKYAGFVSDCAMSKLHDNYLYLHIIVLRAPYNRFQRI